MKTNDFELKLLALEDRLINYAYNLTRDNNDAKDLVQETFYKAIKHRKLFDDSNIQAWVITIMKNTFRNNIKKQKKYLTDADSVDYKLNNRADFCTPETNYSCSEIDARINHLTPEFRIPFQMHINGYKYEEIAKELGLKIGTVKSRIHLARKQLKTPLKGYI